MTEYIEKDVMMSLRNFKNLVANFLKLDNTMKIGKKGELDMSELCERFRATMRKDVNFKELSIQMGKKKEVEAKSNDCKKKNRRKDEIKSPEQEPLWFRSSVKQITCDDK
ncbi:hypothetical protein LOAG_05815 [Loa loa]|uniref:Uncharacterized protein n=1 Tax=Loa loa TaxID=7209 RepID=A0A1S0U0T5_LOALO|nr:hypothetical protein LOAG_05815 [Loa loa]EFO22673.1 hypothetical protein LOAG_05815 [Loa loa]